MSKLSGFWGLELLSIVLLLTGCAGLWEAGPVKWEEAHPPPVPLRSGKIPGPDPGSGGPYTSLHFSVEGYDVVPQQVAEISEKIYSEVMNKTALYSFKPKENYRIVIYRDKEEFKKKSEQPEWSGGLNTGREIFSYQQPALNMVLAHEITHLIFSEYLVGKVKDLRWLNEGLAMNIEAIFHPYVTPASQKEEWEKTLSKGPLFSMLEIASFKPYEEDPARVDLWYKTAASLTAYLLDKGSPFYFSLFLKEIKSGQSVDDAFKRVYPGKIRSQEELYSLWKSEQMR